MTILTLQKERLKDVHQEFLVMEASYWDTEAEKNQDMPENVWDYETYFVMEQTERLVTYTARAPSGQLVGCAFYFLIYHLHHIHHRVAACDSIGTHREYRGQGVARSLFAFAEYEIRKLRPVVNEITHNVRVARTTTPLFPSLGFKPFETVYSKRI